MLEFRLVQHFNRNYNTMQKHVGAERDCGFLQCLQSLQAGVAFLDSDRQNNA
jgi:hypothetical protein